MKQAFTLVEHISSCPCKRASRTTHAGNRELLWIPAFAGMTGKAAFTLVELSIVLVILGLLVGGVLAGQNLIRAAELRSVITEHRNFQTAVMTFREKYFQLPGDMDNAESFWGTMATGTCPDATAGTGTQTCNGDNDGILDDPSAGGRTKEHFTFWQHLANAGLIEGSYSGIAGSSSSLHAIPGENAPASALSQGTWIVRYFGTYDITSAHIFEGQYNNVFHFGKSTATSTVESVFTPQEAWNIDKKSDDGKPGLGNIRARENPAECHDQSTSTTLALANIANYALDETDIACSLKFIGDI